MKNKNINLKGIETPIGGISWDVTPSTSTEIKRIILLLNSKRILVAPIVDSFNRWGEQTYKNKKEPDYVSRSILEIKDYITHQQMEKVIDDTVDINLLGEMIQACNDFLDSWESFDNIFVDSETNGQPIILSSSNRIKSTKIDTKEYMRIVLHNADIVSSYRRKMQQEVEELMKKFKINCAVKFPVEFEKENFKMPVE